MRAPSAGQGGATIAVLAMACALANAADGAFEQVRRAGQDALCAPGTTVTTIVIERTNVFDPHERGEGRFAYRLVNALHRPNQSRVWAIRRVLTLRPGDPCTLDRLDEAERELRRLTFVQDAWADPIARDGDRVTVRVRVRDAWSTRLSASLNSQGGKSASSFRLYEENLLGSGTSIGLERRHDQDRTEKILNVYAPAVLGHHLVFDMQTADNSDGTQRIFRLSRPFWELSDQYSIGTGSERIQREDKVYVGSEVVDTWRRDDERQFVLAGWSPRGLVDGEVTRWYAGLDRSSRGWSLADADGRATRPDLAPRAFDTVSARFEWEWRRIDFRRVRYVNRAVRVEDFDLGSTADVAVTFGLPGLTRDRSATVSGSLQRGYELGDGVFFTVAGSASASLLDGEWYGALATVDARYYRRLATLQTLFLRLFVAKGNRIEGPDRLLLGGDTGLRGYKSRAFSGENEFLAVAEHRYFAPWELLHVVRVGLVGFAEVGGAWDGGLRLGDLHPDIGIGARLAVLRSSHGTTLHFNVAHPLDRADPDGKGLRFSFLSLNTF